MSLEHVVALPSPALVVLAGPPGSGKSTWAAHSFPAEAIVSSDALRAVLGDHERDMSVSTEALEIVDRIVATRLRRGLTVVVDTTGVDAARRSAWRAAASASGAATVLVLFDTPPAECRRRNASRDVPVPAAVLREQLRRWPERRAEIDAEAWDVGITVGGQAAAAPARRTTRARMSPSPTRATDSSNPFRPAGDGTIGVGVHIGSFEWSGGPGAIAAHLEQIVATLEGANVDHVWLMDHLHQIPQVGPPWHAIIDPFTTLAWIAARTTTMRLGTLVSPAFLRHPALLAKAMATIDVLSGGRAICGVGAGWYEAELRSLGIALPPLAIRFELLEDMLVSLPALWGPGTPPVSGHHLQLPAAISYPRPVGGRIPIVVGGGGERRTLRLAAHYGDACNLTCADSEIARKVEALRRHADEAGRDPATIEVTHLSSALIGRDEAEVASLVERLRPPRRAAERFRRDVRAATVSQHADRIERLADLGVGAVMLALPDITEPDAGDRLAALTAELESRGRR